MIGSVVSEKKIFEKVYADDDDADGRQVIAKAHMVEPCELKRPTFNAIFLAIDEFNQKYFKCLLFYQILSKI